MSKAASKRLSRAQREGRLRAYLAAAEVASGLPGDAILGAGRGREVTMWRAAIGLLLWREGLSFRQVADLLRRCLTTAYYYHRGGLWASPGCTAAAKQIERLVGPDVAASTVSGEAMQVAVLRSALRFYAQPESWRSAGGQPPAVRRDKGLRARQALEGS